MSAIKDQPLARNIKPFYPHLVRGRGVKVTDASGKIYLDFCSQTLNLNLGHNHPRIVSAVKKQLDCIYYTSSRFLDEPTLYLAKKLIGISPIELNKVNLKMTGGSEANECAIKMVRKYYNKHTLITTYNSFFGESLETMRCSGKFFDKSFIGPKNDYVYVLPPYCYRCPYNKNFDHCDLECAESFRKILEKRDDIAAIMIEPIIVNAGVILSPPNYLKYIRRVCSEYGIALIFDEVQTAFGWLGCMFASDYYDVVPDIMTIAKGLSAGFPLGAALFNEKYDILDYGEHEFTYGAHTLSCAAALECINVITEKDFMHNVKIKGTYLKDILVEMLNKYDCVGDIRTIGLLAGVEIIDIDGKPDAAKARDVYKNCLENGTIFRLSSDFNGNTIIIKPPLIVSNEEIDVAVDCLKNSIQKRVE